MSTISSATLSLTSSTASLALVKTSNGEYTVASVFTNQKAAFALGLVKETDGNYGQVNPPSFLASPTVVTALASLKLGGN